MSDPCEDICDALVAYVAALAEPTVSFLANVEKTEDPKGAIEAENRDLRVLFYPAKEDAQKIGRGGQCFETFTVAMLVVTKIVTPYTKAALSAFVREIKAAVRGVKMADCTFSLDATPVKVDADQLHDYKQFCSVSEFTYIKAG